MTVSSSGPLTFVGNANAVATEEAVPDLSAAADDATAPEKEEVVPKGEPDAHAQSLIKIEGKQAEAEKSFPTKVEYISGHGR